MIRYKHQITILSIIGLVLTGTSTFGQHCAPITESYLNGIVIKRERNRIDFHLEYTKTGGKTKKAYQAYLLAYRGSDSKELMAESAQLAIEDGTATVVDTQVIKRNEQGAYEFDWKLDQQKFVKQMLADQRIDKMRTVDIGGWKQFEDNIRLAIFIPFLEDRKYSVLDGLPNDRHECNYLNQSALIFEQLPQTLSVHFGIVQAVRLEEGVFYIQMNSTRSKPGK